MYVDILFLLTKAIPFMFGRVATDYQTLQTWIGYNATLYQLQRVTTRVTVHFLSV